MLAESKGIRLEHISKIYQDPKTGKDFKAVNDANLVIEPGSFVTLLGPSGCGKTTTLRMIAGFESPDEGEIYLGDQPINELTPNKRDTAMVFQSYALFPQVAKKFFEMRDNPQKAQQPSAAAAKADADGVRTLYVEDLS